MSRPVHTQLAEQDATLKVPEAVSPWSPLAEPIFRALWIATVASNIGTWMEDVGESWLMVSLTTSPILVALVETAGSLPIVLLAVPAGAFADVVDRRRLLLITQSWMLVSAAALGVFTLAGIVTPWLLLLLTFTLGLGTAMNAPAFQAILPEIVPRREIPAAVTLVSVAVNVSRAVGPALGGLLVAAAGSGPVFLLNALSFLGVIFVIYRWQPAPTRSTMPREQIFGAMRAGLRYVRHAPELRATLVRTAAFIGCASALWALLPLQTRHALGLGSFGYGMLLGCIGAGAVTGAAFLSKVREKVSNNLLVVGATVLFAIVTAVLAHVHVPMIAGVAMFLGGIAWITVMSSFNTAAQAASPAWARARTLSTYTLVFMGGMAFGSAAWGTVAAHFGVTSALTCAALGLIIGLAASLRYRLIDGGDLNLAPSTLWPEPVVVVQPEPEQGPVLVQIEYRIDPNRAQEFRRAMRDMRRLRRRDGAFQWGLFRDPAEPDRFIERFLVETWAEHLRQHGRSTESDREIQKRIRAFHIGVDEPAVTHLIAE
jgi:MFS family permease/quinol monooxygenase YgiN